MTPRARAALAIGGVGVFATSWFVGGLLRDGYDPITDAISELAALGTSRRWLVTTGMVSFGLGALAFSPELGGRARASLAIAGAASLGVAAFPCTEGCPGAGEGELTDAGHAVAAGLHYLAFTSTPLLASRSPVSRAAALVAAIALGSHVAGLGPNGLMQRIGLSTLDAWLVGTAVGVLTTRGEVPLGLTRSPIVRASSRHRRRARRRRRSR